MLQAVKCDFGMRFCYWQLDEGELPAETPPGMAYVIADDELLPTSEGGKKVHVPINTKLHAEAPEGDTAFRVVVVTKGNGKRPRDEGPTEAEKRGEGRSTLPMTFN